MSSEIIVHPIPPVYDADSSVLILGSFPSVKSRETAFFYGHGQNRFWRVVAAVFGEKVPESVDEKKAMLLKNGIAVWDVIRSCEISGSADSSIRNVVPNDVGLILRASRVSRIFTNGKKADELYRKYLEAETGVKAVCLPSTSPANAAWSLDRLTERWRAIKADGDAGI
ncbi:MAG: DNA-deoxyinosine glycosylase [Clostridia bacterium]|nr:DNA-deoxyinosine glycosylase [Clostridia bacterium]